MTVRTKRIVLGLIAAGVLALVQSKPAWAKSPKSAAAPQEFAPAPVPMHGTNRLVMAGGSCCKHKCCHKAHRTCRHECAAACSPCVEYKGKPPKCGVEEIVSVTNPKTCCSVDVVVQVPACKCEKVKRHKDGDVELDYGKFEVDIRWKDHGRRLVVSYDD